MKKQNITYIISDINKALAFEWIAAKIDKRKFHLSFILIVQQQSLLEQFLNENGVTCFTIYYKGKAGLLKATWEVYQALRKLKPNVVHCHLLYGSLIGLTAARLAGVTKRIYTRHHSDYHQRFFPKGIKWDKWCNNMATHIVAPSNAVEKVLIDHERVLIKKITVIPHGFDTAYFSNVSDVRVEVLREKYHVDDNHPVIGVISRFTELKGIQYIIPAFKQLLASYPNALLMLFNAKGDFEVTIKSLLTSIPERSYRLIPFEQDLAAVYRLFDVFIQASTDTTIEAFGQTYVEALLTGIPSIFTLSGIACDFVVDRRNAFVVPFKDASAIYQQLKIILSHYENAKAIAYQGTKDVQQLFALDNMMKSLENLYNG